MYSYRRSYDDYRYQDYQASVRKYGRVRSYRGIPDCVDKELKGVADAIHVPVGEVVRALLEHGLAAHQRGELLLTPTPQAIHSKRRNTLFPPQA